MIGRKIAVTIALGAALLGATLIRSGRAETREKGEAFPAAAPRDANADATLVVYNEKDDDSRSLAKFYAEQRNIAKGHLLGLNCSVAEEISREEYERTIAEPMRRAFTANFWWKLRDKESPLGPVESNKIRFIALIRGIPLKITNAVGYPGDKIFGDPPLGNRNDAAVDSELSTLGSFTRVISGALTNPYFRSFTSIRESNRPELMLVCRLDGPSPGTVRRMITDAIATEREGLAGLAYIDARGLEPGPYREGDDWLLGAAEVARRKGMPVVVDKIPALFPEGYPMRQAAVYYGWYTAEVSGPFTRPGFRFARGAVAVHIHSFSAMTVRDPQHAWVAPLLYSGAAATLGNVYEPYLTLTPHLDVFHDRLCAGFTFAEAAYMSQRVLSWMTTCVGDPLYRPFAGAEIGEDKPASGEWAEYRKGARKWFNEYPAAGEAALKASAGKLRSGAIYEGLGLLEASRDNAKAAIAAFQQARTLYKNQEDIARVAIHEIGQLRVAKQEPEALALARKMIAAYPLAPSAAVIRALETPPAISPPPPAPAPAPAPVSPPAPRKAGAAAAR